MEDEDILAIGVKSYFGALLLYSKDEVGYLFDSYTVEDASEETLAFIAGEVYAIMRFAARVANKKRITYDQKRLAEALCQAVVLWFMPVSKENLFFGVGEFTKEDFDTVMAWYVERMYEGKLVMYVGDDKLYIEGFEWKRDIELRGWLSKPTGELQFTYETQAVSRSAAILEHAVEALKKGWMIKVSKEHNNANLYTGARTCQGNFAEVG